MWEHCKLPQRAWGGAQSKKELILVHFSLKVWHLVVAIFILVHKIKSLSIKSSVWDDLIDELPVEKRHLSRPKLIVICRI